MLGDFLDLAWMRNAMQGVERAYFCYPPHAGGLVEATAIVATAARDAGVAALVNMSQISARQQSASPLARQHWVSELVLDWADIGAVHVRPRFSAEMLLILGARASPHRASSICPTVRSATRPLSPPTSPARSSASS